MGYMNLYQLTANKYKEIEYERAIGLYFHLNVQTSIHYHTITRRIVKLCA